MPKNMHLYLHWHISDPKLTDAEVDRIVDFLGALTDETFLPQRPARVPSGLIISSKAAEALSTRPQNGATFSGPFLSSKAAVALSTRPEKGVTFSGLIISSKRGE